MSTRYFRLNEPDASTEDFQTEILAVNLKSGHYHSMRGAAVPIWRLLMAGHSTESCATLLAGVYRQDPSGLSASVEAFVLELEKAGLVVAAEAPATPATGPSWLAEIPAEYAAPLLESYTDMQDLLLLDPIHDVDTAGWPKVPGQGIKD